jgi:hypothetical protein
MRNAAQQPVQPSGESLSTQPAQHMIMMVGMVEPPLRQGKGAGYCPSSAVIAKEIDTIRPVGSERYI